MKTITTLSHIFMNPMTEIKASHNAEKMVDIQEDGNTKVHICYIYRNSAVTADLVTRNRAKSEKCQRDETSKVHVSV